jgi:hypothetical protein
MMTEEDDFRHLRWFRENGSGKTWNIIGIVVYMGERVPSFGSNMYALPLSAFWPFQCDASSIQVSIRDLLEVPTSSGNCSMIPQN